MKHLTLLFTLLFAATAQAETVTFTWTCSAGGAHGYEVCEGETSNDPDPTCSDTGEACTAQVDTNIQQTKFWRVKAYNTYSGNKSYSVWSNEVRTGAPAAPGELDAPQD